jgi:hypothetical protein
MDKKQILVLVVILLCRSVLKVAKIISQMFIGTVIVFAYLMVIILILVSIFLLYFIVFVIVSFLSVESELSGCFSKDVQFKFKIKVERCGCNFAFNNISFSFVVFISLILFNIYNYFGF